MKDITATKAVEKEAVVDATSELNSTPTKEQQIVVEAEKKASNNRSFFQTNKFALMALALTALTGGTFAAFYFGAISIAAIVTAASSIGLPLEFLTSMSTFAASATLAGFTAGVATALTTAAYGISKGVSALFSWATQPKAEVVTEKTEANQATTENTEDNKPSTENSEQVIPDASAALGLLGGSSENTEETTLSMDSPLSTAEKNVVENTVPTSESESKAEEETTENTSLTTSPAM